MERSLIIMAAMIYDWEENTFIPIDGNELNLNRTYTCKYLCDLVQLEVQRT